MNKPPASRQAAMRTMRVFVIGAGLLFWTRSSLSAADAYPMSPPEAPIALRALLTEIGTEKVLYVRQRFSQTLDLMMRIDNQGPNGVINFRQTRLVGNDTPMSAAGFESGDLIHANGDDATPWFINGTYIGGNHGCLGVIQATSKSHPLDTSDLGSSWTDDAGTEFHLISIRDSDTLWFMSDDKSPDGSWKFPTTITGNVLVRRDGKRLRCAATETTQLTPSCRINACEFLIDGKTPLRPGRVVECGHLDIVEDYDIIDPASALEEIRKNPGREPRFTAPELRSVINNRLVYRIHAESATVITHRARALESFQLGHMGFIQQNLLWQNPGSGDRVHYYIPKTKPFTTNGVRYDFSKLQDLSTAPQAPIVLSEENDAISMKGDMPDRFIQILTTTGTHPAAGFVMGYSLVEGITVSSQRAKSTPSAGFIHKTRKTYPRAIDGTRIGRIAKGTVLECTAYRQYFDPTAQPDATAVHWHQEGGRDIVYADFAGPVRPGRVFLPNRMTGRGYSIIERTPSVTLHHSGTVPASGLEVTVAGGPGHVVLAVERPTENASENNP